MIPKIGDKIKLLPRCEELEHIPKSYCKEIYEIDKFSKNDFHIKNKINGWTVTIDNYGESWIVADEQQGCVTNERGGKQSDVDYAFHLIPHDAVLAVAAVLKAGALKYGIDNWKLIPIEEHCNHSIGHQYKHLSGDRTETHLVNAACRALFALQLFIESEKESNV